MAGKNTAVFGIYVHRSNAEGGVAELQSNGFRTEDISLLLPENLGTKDLGTEKSTKAPEGAAVGAGTGAVIGGALGLLAGIGALAIPGLGPFIAAGPIMATLAGVGAGGVVGGLAGALVGMGVPEYEAKRYEGRMKNGGILMSVHCDNSDWTKRAKDILERTGAEDISSTGEASADFAKSDRPMLRPDTAGGTTLADETVYVAESPAPRTTTVGGTALSSAPNYLDDFREHYRTTYSDSGVPYDEYSPAYEYGYRMGSDPRYRGRTFDEVEPQLRRDYETSHPGSAWERLKESVRYGWDRVTGKARGAGR